MSPPIGMPNSSHGNITVAARPEIRTGSWVRLAASSGAAVESTPSATWLERVAPQRRLNGAPSSANLVLAASILDGDSAGEFIG